ncbi:MAG: hypothetical protein IT436_05980 [Phycisphaerales bacterium]|nr:hypothetical protein [Phycisphaerales bacterium]
MNDPAEPADGLPDEPLLETAPARAPGSVVDFDQACIRCGYNVRGLPTTGLCPECATPVADSLRGFLLRYAAPEYRRRLVGALGLVTNGILILIVVMFTAPFAAALIPGNGRLMVQLAILVPNAMILAGYWFYTTPDPGLAAGNDPARSRRVVRATTGIQIVTLAIVTLAGLASGVLPGPVAMAADVLHGVALTVSLITWIVHFIATMLYTRWVASRIPSRKWMARAALYCWLLPLLVLIPLAVQVAAVMMLTRAVGAGPGASAGAPPAPGPAIALGAGMMWAGCVMIIASLIALVLYWNLLHYVRQMIRRMDGPAPRRAP